MRLPLPIFLLLACSAGPVSAAQPATPAPLLADLFQDHAVFQRDRPISVWGRARPREEVTLNLAGKSRKVRADAGGRWRARLDALPAGGPYELAVSTSSGVHQTVRDILVGDVWLCSGQSNMELDLTRALNSHAEISSSADDGIRLLTISHHTSLTPLSAFKTPVRWQAAAPETVADFSAACYFMARDLRASQKVPMGLIDASWGGTAINAWRSEAGIAQTGRDNEALAILRAYRKDPAAGNRRWGSVWETWWRSRSGDRAGSEPWQPNAASPDWKPVPRLTNWEAWGDSAFANFNGMVWYRATVNLTAAQAARPATVGIGWADEVDQTWVNGVPVGSTYGTNSERDYAIPAGVLKAGPNRLVVNVVDTWGQGGLTGPDELRAIRFADGRAAPITGPWEYKVADAAIGSPPRAPWESNAGLATIYNGMIAPIGPYGLKGVAWYQGEADAATPVGYSAKLNGLMHDWRRQVGQPDLPVLVVQLAGWGPPRAAPVESGFAQIREEQRQAVAADAHAGLAVAIDLGDRTDLHPANKQDVGHRLARAARRIAYGEAISPSGPQAASARRVGDNVVLQFDGTEGGLVTYSSNQAVGFELCGPTEGSCRFVSGTVSGPAVTLAADGGPAERVRFCWGDSPFCNLYDKAGLPAGPFELEVQ